MDGRGTQCKKLVSGGSPKKCFLDIGSLTIVGRISAYLCCSSHAFGAVFSFFAMEERLANWWAEKVINILGQADKLRNDFIEGQLTAATS